MISSYEKRLNRPCLFSSEESSEGMLPWPKNLRMEWFVYSVESSLEGSFVKKEEGYSHGMQWHCVSNCHKVLWRLEVGESLSPN